jgi:AcrR family transcriptional regulator
MSGMIVRASRLSHEQRRQAIVQAAMPLFARKGFAGATTREIARDAGVSEALLFQHFPNKAALYHAILAEGCHGEPALAQLRALPPSTATLVAMTRLMVEHLVEKRLGSAEEGEVKDRLMANSFLEDGEYARLVSAWILAEIFPLFEASFKAAERSGDLQPGLGSAVNRFWFGHHVAAMIAFARLPEHCALPYAGPSEQVVGEAVRFILRGMGLAEAALAQHLAPNAVRPAAARPGVT